MTITELIAALEALRAEHGDLPVWAFDVGYGECEPEEVHADGVSVMADGKRVMVSS